MNIILESYIAIFMKITSSPVRQYELTAAVVPLVIETTGRLLARSFLINNTFSTVRKDLTKTYC